MGGMKKMYGIFQGSHGSLKSLKICQFEKKKLGLFENRCDMGH